MALLEELRTATGGLLYISETDAPWEPFLWECAPNPPTSPITQDTVRQLLGLPAEAPITEQPFEEFFGGLTEDEEWYTPEERADSERYRAVQTLLTTHLTDLHVFRAGANPMDLIVVGRTAEDTLAGLRTKTVET